MNIEKELSKRSDSKCELCGSSGELNVHAIAPVKNNSADLSVLLCTVCLNQLENRESADANHWRCLNDSMWSPVPAVQVVAWRMLNRLKAEGWPQDLLAMLYLDDETLEWAKANGDGQNEEDMVRHIDSNGNALQAGDTVTLIKDLNVKGGGFTAKRGTAVRNIALVADNPDQIEGKVDGQLLVILTQYVKK